MKRNLLTGVIIITVLCLSLFQISCSGKKSSEESSATSQKDSMKKIDTTNLVLACVSSGEKYYFIDTNGRRAIDKEYNAAQNFSEGLAPVCIDDKWGYIDVKGNLIIEPAFEQAEPFSEGLACVGKSITVEGRYGPQDVYGFIDKSGKIVIPYKFEYRAAFNEGFAAVAESETGSSFDICYYFIDKAGKKTFTTANNEKFTNAADFCNGLAKVETQSGVYLINKSGKVETETFETDFSKPCDTLDLGIYPDREEDRLVDLDVDNSQSVSYDMANGNIQVERGKWGYKDKNGDWKIQPIFTSARNFVYTYSNKQVKKVQE